MYPLLVREVQPPLIYVRGDSRLKQHTIEQINILLFISPSIFSLVLRCSSGLRAANPEALGASEST
jgi:hypothetical protein